MTTSRTKGILSFRWAQSVDEIHGVLDSEKADELGAVPILNSSWAATPIPDTGCPDDVLDRLMGVGVAIPTDR
jgi:hypothetical protein